MAANAICVVEPQMEGVFHAAFNAALLHTVVLAYPDARVSFYAMPLHALAVKEVLQEHAPDVLARIAWQAVPPPANQGTATRFRFSLRLLWSVLALRQRTLFCSISRMQLLMLKQLMSLLGSAQVRAVLHGELDSLAESPRAGLLSRHLSLQSALASAPPSKLRYVLLGRSILDHVPAHYQATFANAAVLDHPYHFAAPTAPVHTSPIFGMFGNTGDGELLRSVAQQVRSSNPSARFRLIGRLSDPAAVERLRPWVEDVGDAPLSREAFLERARGITHALWLSGPGSFRLRASGTFFDALSFVKPLIYTANPYIDQYFRSAPNIGVRCETIDDVREAILGVAREQDDEAYLAAQNAILHLRRRFTPEALADAFTSAMDWGGD